MACYACRTRNKLLAHAGGAGRQDQCNMPDFQARAILLGQVDMRRT